MQIVSLSLVLSSIAPLLPVGGQQTLGRSMLHAFALTLVVVGQHTLGSLSPLHHWELCAGYWSTSPPPFEGEQDSPEPSSETHPQRELCTYSCLLKVLKVVLNKLAFHGLVVLPQNVREIDDQLRGKGRTGLIKDVRSEERRVGKEC